MLIVMFKTFLAFVVFLRHLSSAETQVRYLATPKNMTVHLGTNVKLDCSIDNPEGLRMLVQWSSPDGFLFGHDRITHGFPRYSIVGDPTVYEFHLIIKNVSLEDDGSFECQVLASDGTILRVDAYLNVIVSPSKLTLGPAYRDRSTIEVKEGTKLRVSCIAENGKPAAKLAWFRDGYEITDGSIKRKERLNKNRTITALATLELLTSSEDHRKTFECVATHEDGQNRTGFVLTVLFSPHNPRIDGLQSDRMLRMGETVTVLCTVDEGNPPPSVSWFRNDLEIDTSFERDTEQLQTSNEYSFVVDRSDNEAVYECRAVNVAISEPLTTSIRLHVKYPPASVSIVGPSSVRQGDSAILQCLSSPSQPAASMIWVIDGRQQDNARLFVRENIGTHGGGSLTSSNVTVKVGTDRKQDIGVLCSAWNPDLSNQTNAKVSISKTIKVDYPPTDVEIFSNDDRPLLEGRSATFTCISRGGKPLASLQWFIGSRRVTNMTKSAVSGDSAQSVYTFTVDRRHNNARIRCEATNRALDRPLKADKTMHILYPPQFDRPGPITMSVLEDESFVENITFRARPNAVQMQWLRNGREFVANEAGTVTTKGTVLEASTIRRHDAGQYMLIVSNDRGPNNVTIDVTVQYPAVVTKVTSPVYVSVGERASLECQSDGQPQGRLHWERHDRPLVSIRHPNTHTVQLVIPSVSIDDSGRYVCVADNNLNGVDRKPAFLLVRRTPTIDQSRQWTRAAGPIGGRAVLTCRADGVPQVHFHWRPVDGISAADFANDSHYAIDEHQLDHSTFESRLTISHLSVDHYTNMFECVASNLQGSDRHFVQVITEGRPDVPDSLNLVNCSRHSATIGWTPGFNGGFSQKYRIRYRMVGRPDFVSVKVPDSEIHTFRMGDLEDNTAYLVQVEALNREGRSGYQKTPLLIRTLNEDGTRTSGVISRGQMPLLVMVSICLVALSLLTINVYLVLCLTRRRKRRKLREKTELVRRTEGPRPVQMYGPTVGDNIQTGPIRPDSTTLSDISNDQLSEDDRSVRTMIVTPNGHVDKVAIHSPICNYGQNADYVIEYDYDPNEAYTESLRQNSFQRRIATGSYINMPYPEPPDQSAQLHSSPVYSQIVPSRMKFRHHTPLSSPYDLSPSSIRQRPTAIIQRQNGCSSPFAEIRPVIHGSNQGLDGKMHGKWSPSLTTFSPNGLNGTNKLEYVDMEGLVGDLV